jgi:hypothetical protein
MRTYEPVSPTKKLAQTTLSATALKKLDALARAVGSTRAAYLRHLIQSHVKAMSPKILSSISSSAPDLIYDPVCRMKKHDPTRSR